VFDDVSQWNLIMDSTKTAVMSGGLIAQSIGAFEPLHTFSSDTIGVLVTIDANSSLNWIKAGYITQYFDAPLGLSGLAQGESKFVRLFRPSIIRMRDFPSGYKISFDVPKYFEDCTFKVWEFTS
jgi:hypothetical protein